MERHLKAHLYDISTAIDEIQSFLNRFPVALTNMARI